MLPIDIFSVTNNSLCSYSEMTKLLNLKKFDGRIDISSDQNLCDDLHSTFIDEYIFCRYLFNPI